MHQISLNSIDFFFSSLALSVSCWVSSWLEYSWEWNCRATWWASAFGEVSESWIGSCWCSIKGWATALCSVEKNEEQRKSSIEWHPSKHLKARTGIHGIRDKFITVFFLMTYSDIPTMSSGIFFLVFYLLKKIYSISKTLVLNKVIIFYNPLIIFWTWYFWFSEINANREVYRESRDTWTTGQFLQRCFAFKWCVWYSAISDTYGRLFPRQYDVWKEQK